jgi:hypothetical protein
LGIALPMRSRSMPLRASVDRSVFGSIKFAALENMSTFVPLIWLATAVVTGCSTVGSRKAEQADAYKALSARYPALVDEGIIDVGMYTNAVYITWGNPYEIMRVDFPSGERMVWVYTGAVSEPVSSLQYRPGSNPYSARRGTSEPTTTTILHRRTNKWVSFENGKVVSFDSYAPSRAH